METFWGPGFPSALHISHAHAPHLPHIRLYPGAPTDPASRTALVKDVQKRLQKPAGRRALGSKATLQTSEHTPCEAEKLFSGSCKRRKYGPLATRIQCMP